MEDRGGGCGAAVTVVDVVDPVDDTIVVAAVAVVVVADVAGRELIIVADDVDVTFSLNSSWNGNK